MGIECNYENASQWLEFSPWHIMEPENEFVPTNLVNEFDCESPVLGFYPATGTISRGGELSESEKIAVVLWTANPIIHSYSPNLLAENSINIRLGEEFSVHQYEP